jgi:hypothetical protein
MPYHAPRLGEIETPAIDSTLTLQECMNSQESVHQEVKAEPMVRKVVLCVPEAEEVDLQVAQADIARFFDDFYSAWENDHVLHCCPDSFSRSKLRNCMLGKS